MDTGVTRARKTVMRTVYWEYVISTLVFAHSGALKISILDRLAKSHVTATVLMEYVNVADFAGKAAL